MTFQYFVDFDTRKGPESYDPEEINFLMSRLLKGVHMAIVQECGEVASNQRVIAISFPLSDKQDHGGLLRVFSDNEAVIGRLLRHPNIHRYGRDVASAICKVPPSNQFAIFSRSRVNDRLSPSALRRAQQRLQEKGFAVPIISKKKSGFAISAQSDTNGQQFQILVHRQDVPTPIIGANSGFNAYGLAKDSSVPMF